MNNANLNNVKLTTRDRYQRWIDALRSGRYEQGRLALKKDGKYCCLGVLVEVEGAEFPRESQLPTLSLMEEIGLTPYAKMLAEWNDNSHPFCMIAAHIEEVILPRVVLAAANATFEEHSNEQY